MTIITWQQSKGSRQLSFQEKKITPFLMLRGLAGEVTDLLTVFMILTYLCPTI